MISDPFLFTPQLHKNSESSFLCSSDEDEVDGEGCEEELAIPDHVSGQDICRALTTLFSQLKNVKEILCIKLIQLAQIRWY